MGVLKNETRRIRIPVFLLLMIWLQFACKHKPVTTTPILPKTETSEMNREQAQEEQAIAREELETLETPSLIELPKQSSITVSAPVLHRRASVHKTSPRIEISEPQPILDPCDPNNEYALFALICRPRWLNLREEDVVRVLLSREKLNEGGSCKWPWETDLYRIKGLVLIHQPASEFYELTSRSPDQDKQICIKEMKFLDWTLKSKKAGSTTFELHFTDQGQKGPFYSGEMEIRCNLACIIKEYGDLIRAIGGILGIAGFIKGLPLIKIPFKKLLEQIIKRFSTPGSGS